MDWGFGSALAVVLLLLTLLLLALYYLVQSKTVAQPQLAAAAAGNAPSIIKTHWFARNAAGAAIAFLVLPLLIVVCVSFNRSPMLQFPPQHLSLHWYQAFLTDPDWMAAAAQSLRVALIVAAISVTLATLAALGLMRRRFAGRGALQAALLSPLIVPTVITGIGLFYLLSLLHLTDTSIGLVIGHVVLTFPYGIVVISAALERMDTRLAQAAMGLGASPFETFRRVTLPIIRPAIIVAALFAFLISFDEVVVASFLTGPATQTLPVRMWQGIRFDLDPTLAAVSTVLMLISGALAGVGEWLRRRSVNGTDAAPRKAHKPKYRRPATMATRLGAR
jgi:ABC-type spermidine/putrescine transport system permease subunit II